MLQIHRVLGSKRREKLLLLCENNQLVLSLSREIELQCAQFQCVALQGVRPALDFTLHASSIYQLLAVLHIVPQARRSQEAVVR